MQSGSDNVPVDGELLILWSLPIVALIWMAAFFLFPGFVHPLSPALPAQAVADFYRDPGNLPRIRYSMIVFNWFGVGLIPFLALVAVQMRQMKHHTPILSYCFIGCIAAGPTLFCIADLFWLLAAFRPERAPDLTQMFNDLAWVTFTCPVGFLIGQSVFLALGIYLDRQAHPVFPHWAAHFNLLVALALLPATFSATTLTGPLAWDGALSFWIKNLAIFAWMVVTFVTLARAIARRRADAGAVP